MNSEQIQPGIPCVYEQWCFWLGIGFGVFVVALILGLVISVLRDKKKRQQQRRLRKQHKSDD